ncbi:MAG: restriction endonuclease subunit S [Actinobacteria bacterium]|nr:restriction endonuclease subunit S [Actinomycetota bacterium]
MGVETRTGGREATSGVIGGGTALAVGNPGTPAPEGFDWTELLSVARLETGHTPSRRRPEYWGGDVPWIGIKDATANYGRTIDSTNQTVTDEGIANSSARVLPAGTVCLSRTASVGYVVVMGIPMATSQDFVNWVCGPNLDHRYLKYVLQLERDTLLRFASGTTHQTIYFPEAKAFHILLPGIEQQRAIAGVMGALDDKIESNRRLRETADDLLITIFAASLTQDGRPWECSWPTANLGDHLEVLETGRRPPGGVRGVTSGVPSIGAESITRAGEFDYSKLKLVPTDFFDSMKRGQLEDRDVLLYKDGGTPGNFEPHVSMVGQGFPFVTAAINEHVYRLRIRSPYSQDFLYAWLSAPGTMDEMRRRGTGVAIPSLNSANLRTMPFPLPDTARLLAAQAEAEPVMTALLQSATESRTLAELRDALLPELLSGRMRVPAAEDLVKAAT